jgi:hypothetical protein
MFVFFMCSEAVATSTVSATAAQAVVTSPVKGTAAQEGQVDSASPQELTPSTDGLTLTGEHGLILTLLLVKTRDMIIDFHMRFCPGGGVHTFFRPGSRGPAGILPFPRDDQERERGWVGVQRSPIK